MTHTEEGNQLTETDPELATNKDMKTFTITIFHMFKVKWICGS